MDHFHLPFLYRFFHLLSVFFLFIGMSCESAEEIIEVSTGIFIRIIHYPTEMEYYQEESANPIRSGMNQQQIRKEVERVLKPYNTTTYRLLVYCISVNNDFLGIRS